MCVKIELAVAARCAVQQLKADPTMSFIITLYVREGIVMESDSRLTLSTNVQQGGR